MANPIGDHDPAPDIDNNGDDHSDANDHGDNPQDPRSNRCKQMLSSQEWIQVMTMTIKPLPDIFEADRRRSSTRGRSRTGSRNE